MITRNQGDFDGDFLVFVLQDVPEDEPLRMLRWKPPIKKFRMSGLDAVEEMMVTSPEKPPSQVQAACDAAVRGRFIGILTYNMWLLGYTASNHYERLGYPDRASVWPDVFDLYTPLIEGIMDARKKSGRDVEVLCQLFVDTVAGYQDPVTLISQLPKGEDSDKSFNPQQIKLLSNIFALVTEGLGKAPLANPYTGAMMDNVVAKAIARPSLFSDLLANLADDHNPAKTIADSIFCKTLIPYQRPSAVQQDEDLGLEEWA